MNLKTETTLSNHKKLKNGIYFAVPPKCYIWIKNIGSATMDKIASTDVFFGRTGNFRRMCYKDPFSVVFPSHVMNGIMTSWVTTQMIDGILKKHLKLLSKTLTQSTPVRDTNTTSKWSFITENPRRTCFPFLLPEKWVSVLFLLLLLASSLWWSVLSFSHRISCILQRWSQVLLMLLLSQTAFGQQKQGFNIPFLTVYYNVII